MIFRFDPILQFVDGVIQKSRMTEFFADLDQWNQGRYEYIS